MRCRPASARRSVPDSSPRTVPAHRHHADEVLEDRAELLLGPDRVDALGVGPAVGRPDLQSGAHGERGRAHARGFSVDLVARDPTEVGHRRFGAKARFLFGDGQRGTDVGQARRDLQRGERGVEVGGPASAIGQIRREQAGDLRPQLRRTERRRLAQALVDRAAGERSDAEGGERCLESTRE